MYVTEVLDSDSEPDIDPVENEDMLFDGGINTKDEAEKRKIPQQQTWKC